MLMQAGDTELEPAFADELDGGVSFEISPHGFDDAFLFRVRHS